MMGMDEIISKVNTGIINYAELKATIEVHKKIIYILGSTQAFL